MSDVEQNRPVVEPFRKANSPLLHCFGFFFVLCFASERFLYHLNSRMRRITITTTVGMIGPTISLSLGPESRNVGVRFSCLFIISTRAG